MKILDVNVLIAHHREDADQHENVTAWLASAISDGELLGLAVQSAVGLVRIATNPRAFVEASSLAQAFGYLASLRQHPSVRTAHVGPRHLGIFEELCTSYDVRGKTVSDAHLAALAVEHAATVVSFDRDFARFSSVPWEIPA